MTHQPPLAPPPARPIQNLRITFWGVQGSCPIFPTPDDLQENRRRLAVHTLTKAVQELTRSRLEDILGGPPAPENIAAWQRRIGLPNLPFYGGETTCIEVETSEGNLIIFDAGSGIRRCSLDLTQRWATRADRAFHLFGTHEHLDHRAGLSFARFCYIADYTIHVHGTGQFLRALDQHYGIFSHQVGHTTYMDDPIDYKMMPARFTAEEIGPAENPAETDRPWPVRDLSDPARIGATTVQPFDVYHSGTRCLAYKLTHNGKTFILCTDHELRHGKDPDHPNQRRSLALEENLRQHCRNADLAYFDGQYFLDEYLGQRGIGSSPPLPRIDWGHSCVEDVIDRALQCNIRRTLVGHHDPERAWPQLADIDRHLQKVSQGKPNRIQLADSDRVIDL